jgi:hypothetical protein
MQKLVIAFGHRKKKKKKAPIGGTATKRGRV